ncbi:restriction endonuclease subunit S [Klebsiella variicola]|uniref:restriction endonuclease subunit S n=1 Tax=Klebsiella variicola TaxID=244366 RepID=UPI0021815E75|nr:restriction endonuclease subunit S [Klebsiella variicola]GKL77136.1 restriction endonuclease subunit S [Klebsiella variicola]HCI8840171.1 restriction endonuclease subunit S [Klebsiella variicola]
MSVDNMIPEIRFKGFSEAWKNKKIGGILSEIKRPIELMDNESYQLVTVKRRNEGVVPRAVLKGKNILVKNYFSVKAGDYLISKRQVVHGANGIVPDNLDGAVVSNEYLVVTDSDDITARYWTVISIRPEMHKLFFVSSYGVDIEKLVFDVTDWKNRTIVIPQVTEQKNITDYFQKLDELINQHQHKYDKFRNIKKAMLEKMFPKQGETIPEIRFKGFSGEWEEKKIFDEAIVTTGYPFDSAEFSSSGDYLVITNGNIQNNSAVVDGKAGNRIASDKIACLSQYILNVGDILITMDGSVGRTAKVIATRQILAQRVGRLVAKNNTEFLYQSLNTGAFLEAMTTISHGGTIKHISLSEISNYALLVPKNLEEQVKIGNYLKKLDDLIAQHQQQITKLNNIKQACLSKMFV